MTGKLPTARVEYGGNELRKTVVFANGDSELLLIRSVGPDQFRLEESSLLSLASDVMEVRFHDVIRATTQADGSLRFHEVVSKSDLQTSIWLLSRQIVESADLRSVLDDVTDLGGASEQAFGGYLLVHMPPAGAEAINERIRVLLVHNQTR